MNDRAVWNYVLAVDLADRMGIPRQTLYAHVRTKAVTAETINGRLMIHKDEAARWATLYPTIKRRPRTRRTDTGETS